MNRIATTLTVLCTATCLVGCASQIDESANHLGNESTSGSAEKTMLNITTIDAVPKLTEEVLAGFEEKYQCRLPNDYRRFMLANNGGFPSPDCVVFQEAGRTTASDVFCFHCITDERPWASMQWHWDTFAGRLPKDTLPIAHDSCGNLWLLSVGPDHGNAVIFWDHGTFDNFDETDFDAWPKVANSFDEFLGRLSEYRPLPEDEELLSRYALVKRAVEGMAKQSPDFDKYTAVDAAWHCDYSEDGRVQMQLVNYVPHAAVTHTDGYSRLRASKGLNEEGPARLPK